MFSVRPQIWRVGGRRPLTYAIYYGADFICYTRSFCVACDVVRDLRYGGWWDDETFRALFVAPRADGAVQP